MRNNLSTFTENICVKTSCALIGFVERKLKYNINVVIPDTSAPQLCKPQFVCQIIITKQRYVKIPQSLQEYLHWQILFQNMLTVRETQTNIDVKLFVFIYFSYNILHYVVITNNRLIFIQIFVNFAYLIDKQDIFWLIFDKFRSENIEHFRSEIFFHFRPNIFTT